ncbi:hypothetical protein Y023_5102 [Burkholderia pseudomallei A79D]|nr:hypothetical protein Y023_5102 [Burkholderia pseudomallei A79D]KGX97340.1 hypothetical protein X997_4785 [Burkholderia pseudomallei A79C]
MRARQHARAVERGGKREAVVVGDERAFRLEARAHAAALERPGVRERRVAVDHAVMLREIGRRGGPAEAREIAGARAQQAAVRADRLDDLARQIVVAHPQREIEAFADDVDVMIGQRQFDPHTRKGLRERRAERREDRVAERMRGRDAQQAARLVVALGQLPRAVREPAQHVGRGREIEPSAFRQREPARRALEQLHAERRLEAGDRFRHRRRRFREPARRLAEAAFLDRADEGFERGQQIDSPHSFLKGTGDVRNKITNRFFSLLTIISGTFADAARERPPFFFGIVKGEIDEAHRVARRRARIARVRRGARGRRQRAQHLQLGRVFRARHDRRLREGNRHQGAARRVRQQRSAANEADDGQQRLRSRVSVKRFSRTADSGGPLPEAR